MHETTTKQKLANTIEMLGQIWPSFPSTLTIYVKWSAMFTAHFFLLRCGEFTVSHSTHFLTHLTLDDVQFRTSPGGTEFVALRLKTSNTDQFRKSHSLFSGHGNSAIWRVCCLQMLIRRFNPRPIRHTITPPPLRTSRQPPSPDPPMFLSILLISSSRAGDLPRPLWRTQL